MPDYPPPPDRIRRGRGTPEGAVQARVGTLYLRDDAGVGTALAVKESGTSKTGWGYLASVPAGTPLVAGRVVYTDANGRLATDAGLAYNAATDALTLTGDLVLGARVVFSPTAAKILGGATSLSLRNNADTADNILVSDAGVVTIRSDLIPTGRILFAPAVAKIAGGATSLSLRNNADNADNLLVTDAGVVSVRSTLNALAGENIGTATGAATGELRASGGLRSGDTTSGYLTHRVLTILTNNTATIFPGGSYGVAFIHETNTIGVSAAYACEQTGTFEIFDQGGVFTITLNNPGTINIYHDGTNFVAQNKTAGTIILRCWCLHGI
jgi:hypothetical protein